MMDQDSFPIADLHCDLLSFLSRNASHSPFDPAVRCSIPQLQQGNVKLQTLAIFTETGPSSYASGKAQAEIFKRLPILYPEVFQQMCSQTQIEFVTPSQTPVKLIASKPSKIEIIAAIENCSAFCEEQQPLEQVFQQLKKMLRVIGTPAYISLTWNSENRFGGGASTCVGLKSDGMSLLEFLADKQIPLDLSHASDCLAGESLNFLDKKRLSTPLVASHSNLRSVSNVPRNLPDEIAQEIISRKGLIGLNFFRPFVEPTSHTVAKESKPETYFFQHLNKILHFQGADHVCFGADFFHDDCLSAQYKIANQSPFFPKYSNASSYPSLLDIFIREHLLPIPLVQGLAYNNLAAFLSKRLSLRSCC